MKKFKITSSLLILIIVILIPFNAFAFTLSEDVKSYEDKNLTQELGVQLPTFKYSTGYNKTYTIDTDVDMYVYIIVDYKYLDNVTFNKSTFSMSSGECILVQYDPNSEYSGNYQYIQFSSSEEFDEKISSLEPKCYFNIENLVSFCIPENTNTIIINDYCKLIDFDKLLKSVNTVISLLVGVIFGVGILIGSQFLKHFSFWKW